MAKMCDGSARRKLAIGSAIGKLSGNEASLKRHPGISPFR